MKSRARPRPQDFFPKTPRGCTAGDRKEDSHTTNTDLWKEERGFSKSTPLEECYTRRDR